MSRGKLPDDTIIEIDERDVVQEKATYREIAGLIPGMHYATLKIRHGGRDINIEADRLLREWLAFKLAERVIPKELP